MSSPQDKNSKTRRSDLSASKLALLNKWMGGGQKSQQIPRRSDPRRAPISFAQQRLWFLEQLVPGSSVYNMHDAVRIRGKIDPTILTKVLSRLVARHESLRTTFTMIDEQPVQIVSAPAPLDLPIEDVSGYPESAREARAVEIATEETFRPFDLEKGPLFRARLIRIDETDHILLWTMHHIVSDGWSLGVIIKEVMTLLEAYANGREDPLPPLPIQFGDFSAWQREWLTGEVMDKQLSYWRHELGSDLPAINLPLDHPRPDFPANTGKRKVTIYAPALGESLKTLALKENVTLFMVLLSAFDVLLHRYSAMEQISVGVPVANRNRTELQDLIGFFANTLVMRADFSQKPTYLDLLRQVRDTAMAAYEHQDIPFERLVEVLQPERTFNRPPFFQVMFVLQNQPMPAVDQPGLRIEPIEIHNSTSKFDILLNVFETPEGFNVGIEYADDLFDEDTIERMLEHYRILLQGIVERPESPVDELPMLSEAEKQTLLFDWNQTIVEYPGEIPHVLSRWIEGQAKKTPNAYALAFGKTRWTYRELNERSNQLAHILQSHGIGPESIVAICVERSVELVVGLLGIMKAGGAYVPLDAEYPADRLAFMLEDCQAPVLLYKGNLPAWVDETKVRAIEIDLESEELLQRSTANPQNGAEPDDLAYVIFTSGSTGRPKGAMNTHRAICNRLLWMQAEYGLGDDRILQKTPASFDVSVWEFFWPLMTGAELVVSPPGAHRDAAWLARIIQEEDITTLHFVPSMLQLFLTTPEAVNCRSLRRVICSGEALPFELQKTFQQTLNAELHNLYGPTEAAVDVTFWDCSQTIEKNVVPIGRPIANTQIYILDRLGRPTPIGIPGELHIGGRGVGRGYLNRPELTREKFVPDPFRTDTEDARLYKTGDLARFWKNGVIEFLGRIDSQVKIRGLRIELNEIEHVLLQTPEIREAVVIVREDSLGDQRLTAYLVPDESSKPDQPAEDDSYQEVSEWQMVFEQTYSQSEPSEDATSNIVGWNSSYSGLPISAEGMQEWVDVTVDRIREFHPRRILEVGCGTGLLLFRLAGDCEKYVGTDISATALNHIRSSLPQTRIDPQTVELHQASAHELSLEIDEPFDVVVLNSIVQYFPSVDYLLQVLQRCLKVLKPGGVVFLGDLRNEALSEVFATSVELFRAAENATVSELKHRIRRRRQQERELNLNPRLFDHLPSRLSEMGDFRVLLRRGIHDTEMGRFRYDVILRKTETTTAKPSKTSEIETRSWGELGFGRTELENRLLKGLEVPLIVRDIPNARVWGAAEATNLLASTDHPKIAALHALAEKRHERTVDPENLWAEAERTCRFEATWAQSGNPGTFDAFFFPLAIDEISVATTVAAAKTELRAVDDLGIFANDPNRSKRESQILARLKNVLREKLPEFMVPSHFLFLESIPLSQNGKIDRKALPAPEQSEESRFKVFIAPGTPTEKVLAELWGELLQVSKVSATDNFFDLGGHSLLAAQMVLRIRQRLGFDVPLRLLFQSPTVQGMARDIDEHRQSPSKQENLAWSQMLKDSFLPATITASGKPPVSQSVRNVFLTGSTGFLGAYLLRDLLNETDARVHCLVRCEDEQAGLARLEKVLSRYRILDGTDWKRVVVEPGDLGEPELGLGEDRFAELSKEIDLIVHCGANVNFIAPYDQLRASNVEGTVEIFRLASNGHTKPVHFVSSIYTLTGADQGESFVLNENHVPRHGETLGMGYLQTKWVAERLAEAARDRRIPVTIYRPGRISGDSLTGACQENDFYWGLVRACLALGAAPAQGLDENLTPVDHVSRSIVRLSRSPSSTNRTYHLIHPEILPGRRLVDALRKRGYDLPLLDYPEWKELALKKLRDRVDDPSARLAGFLFGPENETEPSFTSEETEMALENLGLGCPANDDALLLRSINYFIESGFFPDPELEAVH